MIRKSGCRFSEKIMLKKEDDRRACFSSVEACSNFHSRYWKHPLMRDAVRHSTGIALLSLFVSVASGSGVAQAQSGSAGGSIGNDEKSLSGSREAPRATESSRTSQQIRGGRTAPRIAKERWRRRQQFRWRVDCELRGRHMFGHQQQRGRRHQRQDYRSDARGTVSPDGRVYGTSSGNGLTVITVGRLSGRSGGGTFKQSDGCTGRWTAAKQ